MRYPIAIEPGDDTHTWGVVAPYLPGCFSAGDTLDEAIANASKAITLWIETVLDDGGDIPKPGSVSAHGKNPDFAGWIWTLNEVDPALLEDHTERVTTIRSKALSPPQ